MCEINGHAAALCEKRHRAAFARQVGTWKHCQTALWAINAETVGTDNPNPFRGYFLYLSFQFFTFGSSQFTKPGRENLRAHCTLFPAGFQGFRHQPGSHGDNGKVDFSRNIFHSLVDFQSGNIASFWVDREYFPLKAHRRDGSEHSSAKTGAVFFSRNADNSERPGMKNSFIIHYGVNSFSAAAGMFISV